MRKFFKYFKPYDYIIIIAAIIISFVPNIITSARYGNLGDDTDKIAIVKIDGEIVDEYVLTEDSENTQKTYYPNEGQYNTIEVENGSIRIKEDNSPDQIGVNTGWISKPGQTAVCLPHGFIVEVTGQIPDDDLILPL